eukprot:7845904-Pyramimonas_sp.AAC.1
MLCGRAATDHVHGGADATGDPPFALGGVLRAAPTTQTVLRELPCAPQRRVLQLPALVPRSRPGPPIPVASGSGSAPDHWGTPGTCPQAAVEACSACPPAARMTADRARSPMCHEWRISAPVGRRATRHSEHKD